MELFYYSKMNKMQQAAYHAICQERLADGEGDSGTAYEWGRIV